MLFFPPTGYKSASQASMFTSFFMGVDEENIPVPFLNDGNGGEGAIQNNINE
ncbi:hypothetical protein [Thalassobellus suaedae]|uniref:Uncharacterized protein n=1 Tax=Thalassobellus suaedae TaxID=3074124 RepID=A0ABY9XXK1_9FLAO|nr:hypothetical protein RHP51_07700 [Flavobacteriaceae bacterium HL-DH14]WNH12522.1 hypothetical protein RHP49_16735 [Flavobacteriaceae bacterium HL-DH10]